MSEGAKDAPDSKGYSSLPVDDSEEWSKLRGLSEKESEDASAAARQRKKNLAVLLLLVGLLGFLASQPLMLPDEVLTPLALTVRDWTDGTSSDDSGPILPSPAADASVAQPRPKGKAGGARPAAKPGAPTATPPAEPATVAAAALPERPFAGGIEVVRQDPSKLPFGVEVVDNRDRRFSPAPRERIINLADKGTSQHAEAVPKAADRMRITPGPIISKEANVNGSVKLRAVISAEGAIKELAVVSGPTELGPAAIQVARQWRYRPYYFNGRPVETETYITINFNISTN
ncbi:MAG TPA: energy transducer TonB [Terriglobales bacterium]|nr:energy transducer TonB [Terriglobales bacterium]